MAKDMSLLCNNADGAVSMKLELMDIIKEKNPGTVYLAETKI